MRNLLFLIISIPLLSLHALAMAVSCASWLAGAATLIVRAWLRQSWTHHTLHAEGFSQRSIDSAVGLISKFSRTLRIFRNRQPLYSENASEYPLLKSIHTAEVPPAFEEELKNDHGIVKCQEGNVSTKGENQVVTRDLQDPGLLRGRPRFRMSTNVGSSQARNVDPETANMCLKDEAHEEDGALKKATLQESSSPTNDESNATKLLPRPGIPARGTLHFRISVHQEMRPGGPLSRDLKAESTKTYTGGNGAGAEEFSNLN